MNTKQVCRLVRLAAVALAPSIVFAQDTPPQQQKPAIGPPVQRIATASALSTEQIGNIMGVRELSDGRVLVNDGLRRRLLLMDTSLKTLRVVLDSVSEISNTYGTRTGALLALRSDTTLFIDPVSYAMLVLDGEGNIVRVRSVWRVQDVFFVTSSGFYGFPGIDAKGRVVYRIQAQAAPPKVAPPPGVPWFPTEPDSAFIVAVTLDTRKIDTVGVIRTPKNELRVRQTQEGRFMIDEVRNPLPLTDDWAVLPNGTIAFVRGRDYRIDYLKADGTTTSSPKIPFEWQRMTDEAKEQLVDSLKIAMRKQALNNFAANMIRWVNMYGKSFPAGFTVPDGFTPPPGMPKEWTLPPGVKLPDNYMYACPPGVDPMAPPAPGPAAQAADKVAAVTTGAAVVREGAVAVPPPTSGAALPGVTLPGMPGGPRPTCAPAPVVFSSGQAPPPPTLSVPSVIDPRQLPDYRPPFTQGSVRADAEGNLWVRTIPPRPIPGGPVYDIISPEGELVNRLQTPPGYAIVGFGKGKVVYLSMRDATGVHLARVRLR